MIESTLHWQLQIGEVLGGGVERIESCSENMLVVQYVLEYSVIEKKVKKACMLFYCILKL